MVFECFLLWLDKFIVKYTRANRLGAEYIQTKQYLIAI